MNSRYEKALLNRLLDKYENSKSFSGQNVVRQSFRLNPASIFPLYRDHADYDTFSSVNEAIEILQQKDFIRAARGAAREYKSISLNLDNLEQAYRYIGRIPKRSTQNQLRELLTDYSQENAILRAYCREQLRRLEMNKPVQYFRDDLQELENILLALSRLPLIETEQYQREFSIQVYKDSKTFQRIRKKVENILFDYGDYPEKEHILSSYNLVRTPTYVNFKGAGRLEIAGQQLDLQSLSGDIALSAAILPEIKHIEVSGGKVITIENLTSFHRFDLPGYFVLYLGGFHNRVRQIFIKKLYEQNPRAVYYHFGDIDAGGFYILEHLRRNTGVDFQPYKMDIPTLVKYCDYAKRLSENDKVRLKRLQNPEYREVISYMLENNCKLEQEAVAENI